MNVEAEDLRPYSQLLSRQIWILALTSSVRISLTVKRSARKTDDASALKSVHATLTSCAEPTGGRTETGAAWKMRSVSRRRRSE